MATPNRSHESHLLVTIKCKVIAMNILRNHITRLLAIFALAAVFAGVAHAADRYVYYSIADQTYYAEGVCSDSTTEGFHTQLNSAADYIETWDDGVSNGLDALEVGVSHTAGTGTYHVATLNGSGEKVYLVISN